MSKCRLEADMLDAYQLIQYKHDKNYHPEILSLGVVGRMKHIVLHLMKYRAKLSAYKETEDQNTKALIDTFIMLVSSSNALAMKISDECIFSMEGTQNENDFLEEYIQIIGKMAKATESADHQEDYSINKCWKECTIRLLNCTIAEAYKREITLTENSATRLNEVERNHKLYFILKDVL